MAIFLSTRNNVTSLNLISRWGQFRLVCVLQEHMLHVILHVHLQSCIQQVPLSKVKSKGCAISIAIVSLSLFAIPWENFQFSITQGLEIHGPKLRCTVHCCYMTVHDVYWRNEVRVWASKTCINDYHLLNWCTVFVIYCASKLPVLQ